MNRRKWAVWPGKPYPLGATWDGEGVNFALFSEQAEKVQLCENNIDLLRFVRLLVAIRKEHPLFRRRHFFQGRKIKGDIKDIIWLNSSGEEMSDEEWQSEHARCLGLLMNGSAIEEYDSRGRVIRDDSFLLLFNAGHEDIAFGLQRLPDGPSWRIEIDTGRWPDETERSTAVQLTSPYRLTARSLVLLVQHGEIPE